jgi:hypothetical protein
MRAARLARVIGGSPAARMTISAQSAMAANGPPLFPDEVISLNNTKDRIDHMAVDLKRRRLFVAEHGKPAAPCAMVVSSEPGRTTGRTVPECWETVQMSGVRTDLRDGKALAPKELPSNL